MGRATGQALASVPLMTTASRSVRSLALVSGTVLLATLGLAACGGSGGSSSSSSAAPASSSEPPAPNPSPQGDCSETALNSAAKNATGGSFGGVESFVCDGGYAAVTGQMNDQESNLLFQVKDGSWMPVEIQEVCQAGGLPSKISDVVC